MGDQAQSFLGPISELLLHWEELRARNEEISAAELCRGHPALVEEVTRRIQALEAMYGVPNQLPPTVIQGAAESPGPVPVAPQVVGYEVLGELGQGGMGVVYKARHLRLNRLVALKMILAGARARPSDLLRFRFEAEAVAALQHPHIVQLYEVGEADGCPYLTLEYIDGGSLEKRHRERPCSPREAAGLIQTLALAADYAHRRGVIHRDLKPANVLLTADHQPKISDFGLAKRLGSERGQTATGNVMGTPSYMAPEQAQGRTREVGPATDVYALGAILYYLLTGRPPFEGDTPLGTLLQVTGREPVPPSQVRQETPRDLETICLKCLRKEPAQRYASALELANDLQRFQSGEPIRARPVSPWERGVKWARRRPAAALLVVTLFVAALSVQGLILWYSTRLEDSLRQAQTERDKANEQEQLTRRNLYAAHMHLAQQALEQGQVALAVTLLENQRPTLEHAEDLRGFEWYHLWQRCHQERALLFAGKGDILASTWAPPGVRLAVRGKEGTIAIWDAPLLPGPASPPRNVLNLPVKVAMIPEMVAFSPDGHLVVVVVEDGSLRLWNVTAGEELFARLWPAEPFSSVAFAPDGKTLAAGDHNGRVTLWDVSTRPRPTLLNRQRKHDRRITALVFSPSGCDLALCGSLRIPGAFYPEYPDRIMKVWEVATSRGHGSLALPSSSISRITRVVFAPNGKTLAVAYGKSFNVSSPDRLQLLDARGLKELASRSIPAGGAFAAAFSPDGGTLATGENSGVLRLWQLADAHGKPILEERGTLYGHTNRVEGLSFSPDGRMLVSTCDDQTVRLWELPPRPEPAILSNPGRTFRALALAPDGRTMATMDRSRAVVLWDLATQQPRGDHAMPAHNQAGSIPSFSSDGEQVVVPQEDFTVKVWGVAGGQLRATLKGHGNFVTGTAFRPGGRLLATASRDGTVKLWDVATWQELATLRGHTGTAWSLAFSPDGETLASGGDDGKVRLWDVDAGECRATFDGPGKTRSGVMTLAFTPDGKTLAAGTYDGHLQMWHLDSGTEGLFPRRHGAAIVSAVFTPDAQTLITGSKDGTIKLWDVATRQERLTLKGHTDEVQGVALTRDGETLISVSEDGTIRLWHAPGYAGRK
jgi:WD40 repeat protein/serine/threonine protein kinase